MERRLHRHQPHYRRCGMTFGSVISVAVLILAAVIFAPQGVKFEHYSQLPTLLVPVFGYWGFWLVLASVGIACLGAAMEITLEIAYFTAQGFGWNWSENQPPIDEARFSAVYTLTIILGAISVARWTRSLEADDLLDGVDCRNLAGFDRAVSFSNERLQLRANLPQRLVLERSGDTDHRSCVCPGRSDDPFADFWRRMMDLVRDCLDKRIEDRKHRPMGRVDGIVLELEPDRPPRVAYIELGAKTLMDRLSVRLGNAIARRLSLRGIESEPYRIPWSKLHVGVNVVEADVEAEKTPALEWELWLRKKVIGRIPGA